LASSKIIHVNELSDEIRPSKKTFKSLGLSVDCSFQLNTHRTQFTLNLKHSSKASILAIFIASNSEIQFFLSSFIFFEIQTSFLVIFQFSNKYETL
jgi:hypothetical protein